MTVINMVGRGLRGESFADVARRAATIAGIAIAPDATDAEVMDALADGLRSVVEAAGYTVIDPVETATSAPDGDGNIVLSGEQTISGVLTNASRVLLTDQTDAAENGIWVTAAGAWARPADFDDAAEVVTGSLVPVTGGDRAGRFVLVTQGTITVGTTDQVWRVFDYRTASKIIADDGETAQEKFDALEAATILRPTYEEIGDIRRLIGGDGDISSMIGTLRSAGVNRAWLAGGAYTLAPSTEFGDLILEAERDNVTITPAAGAGDYLALFTGSATALPDLGADAVKGNHFVEFASAPSLNPGDVFQIYNPTDFSYSGFRDLYRAGEYCFVKEVSGTTVYLEGALRDNYAALDVDLYKINPAKGGLANVRFESGAKGMARFIYGRRNLLENISGTAVSNVGVHLDRCTEITVDDPGWRNYGIGSDDYGLVVGNSQIIRVNGGKLYSRRHPIDLGGGNLVGGVPTRDVVVDGTSMKNDIRSNVTCADFHGNAENCRYINCPIDGGGVFGGKDNGYINCRITNANAGMCLYGTEMKGGDYFALGCTLETYVNPASGSRGIIDFSDSCITGDTVETVNIRVLNTRIKSSALSSSSSMMRLANSGTSQKVNMTIDGMDLTGINDMLAVLYTEVDSGTADSDGIIVDNIRGAPTGSGKFLAQHIGSAYAAFPHRLQRQTGKHDGTTTAATKSYTSSALNLPLSLPMRPTDVQVTLMPTAGSALSPFFGGSAPGQPYVNLLSTTAITLGLAAASNYGSASAFSISYSAGVNSLS